MSTLEAIAGRRSIRKFKDEPLPDGALWQILTAATLAPSGKNRQPWRFHVVTAEKRDEMIQVMREGIENTMIAAVSLGYADESPEARPRRSVDQVAKWV